jgi:hypothetical protein
VTNRDTQIVRWVGRLRMATAQQIAERFGLGRTVTYARLGVLVRLGLLEHARIFHGAPGVYVATRAGLAAVDLALPRARVDLRTYAHDLELSSLVVDLEREFGREQVSTEREMRAADTPAGLPPAIRPRFAVGLAGALGQLQLTPAGHPRLHSLTARSRSGPVRRKTRCSPSSSSGVPRDGRGYGESCAGTSPPETSVSSATTCSATASARWLRARSPPSTPRG